MIESARKPPDGGVIKPSIVTRFDETFGIYGWFGLTELALLAFAFVLNMVFEMPIVAGLIGAFVFLMAVNVSLIGVGLFAYRLRS